MGHRRIGVLPTSQRWQDIAQLIAGERISDAEVADIAQKTIQNVRSRFRHIERDDGVLGTFQFLVNLAIASRKTDPQAWLLDIGIELPDNLTPLSFAKAVNAYVASKRDSLEYGGIALQAAGDTISNWYDQNKEHTLNLFELPEDPFEVWRKAGDGAGFCELSRLFFAKFTQRYLEYFLQRAAAVTLRGVDERIQFEQQLAKRVDDISLHAFETAKITQSFAAGWFNNRVKGDVPNEKEIEEFLSVAFGKIRDALQREDDKE